MDYPFGKISIFGLFELLFFYSLERCFFVLEYRKGHFAMLYCRKKNLEKWPFLDQNHGLTPYEKCPFFDFLNLFFCSLKRFFFVLQHRKTHFPGQYCLIKKSWKNGNFWTKAMG